MSTATVCTMCDGDQGVFAEAGRPGLRWFACGRCEGTGVEPFDVAAMSDAELVAYVEAADIEGHIKTDVSAL